MLRTMAAAYEVAQLRHRALHPSELWWLATQGSARALRADDRIWDFEINAGATAIWRSGIDLRMFGCADQCALDVGLNG